MAARARAPTGVTKIATQVARVAAPKAPPPTVIAAKDAATATDMQAGRDKVHLVDTARGLLVVPAAPSATVSPTAMDPVRPAVRAATAVPPRAAIVRSRAVAVRVMVSAAATIAPELARYRRRT